MTNNALSTVEAAGAHDETGASHGWVFLLPQLELRDGGHLAQKRFFDISFAQRETSVATYNVREQEALFLDDMLAQTKAENDHRTYCIHYGPHVSRLCKKLRGRKIIYFAHSTGWKITLPTSVAIICVSRQTLGYWGKKAPKNRLFYLPNVLESQFCLPLDDQASTELSPIAADWQRPYDITVIARKMSPYLMKSLLPKIEKHCHVNVIDRWVPDVAWELKRSKLFLYDSVGHWSAKKVTEGFGLPPLEALACGCTVFSSLNDALADYLEPTGNCFQIGAQGMASDLLQIFTSLAHWREPTIASDIVNDYRRLAVANKLSAIATQLAIT